MFGKNRLIKIVEDAGGALSATVEERTIGQAVGDYFKSLVDDKVAVTGAVSTAMPPVLMYVTSVGTNRVLTGRWNYNPLAI